MGNFERCCLLLQRRVGAVLELARTHLLGVYLGMEKTREQGIARDLFHLFNQVGILNEIPSTWVLPFSLIGAPPMFQHLMDKVLRPHQQWAAAYMDICRITNRPVLLIPSPLQENYSILHKKINHTWDFVVMQAREQLRASKQRRKADRIVLECQEQAYWLTNKPCPGAFDVLDLGPERCNVLSSRVALNADHYKREIEHSRRALGRNRVKSSICLESFMKYSEQYLHHDPIMSGCLPSNPWISDDTSHWTINTDMVGTPTRLRVERWSFSFMELLNDSMGRREFMIYLEKEFSAENLCFWVACEDLRHGESSKIILKVEEVYKNFLAPGAARWVNIDSRTMERTLEGIKRPHRFIMDDAQMHIYFLMKKDSYPRYLKSELYKNMLAKAIVPQETKK
ncbi:regulator of G-protein signaling 11-like, partial [Oncorhynchus nerka]|uniref:regulator of G-protein signaling 11-like n=1 Tax=Oncorhynchus nerka TaxID=8023 RepID=UPI0031B83BA0